MRNNLPPGVSLAPQTPAADVRLVRTDIAGLVGFAERGPLAPADSLSLPDSSTLAIRLTSWAQYRTHFGGLTRYALMPYAVRAFFENGGTTCYVVRVASAAAGRYFDGAQTAAWSLSRGDDASQLTTLTQALKGGANEVNLTVASTAGFAPGAVAGVGVSASDLNVRTVKTVVDAQTLSLSGPIDKDRPAGTGVWLLTAAPLAAELPAGQTDVPVSGAGLFRPGDAVALTNDGIVEFATVAGIVNAATVRLAAKVRGNYPAGTLLRKQIAGLQVEARSPGNWGDRIWIDLTPRDPGATVTRFDLRASLQPGPDQTQPPEAEQFLNLSLDPNDPRYAPAIVNYDVNANVNGSNLVRLTIPPGLVGLSNKDLNSYFPRALEGGRDGLSAVTVNDFIGADGDYRGLRVLEEIDEVGILLAPDAINSGLAAPAPPVPPDTDPCQKQPEKPPDPVADDPTAVPRVLLEVRGVSGAGAVYQAMIDQARRLRYRVAVLDTPDNLDPIAVATWVKKLALPAAFAPFAAVHYPWLKVPDGLTNERGSRRVPAGGHVAGVFAQVDNTLGVQHPPANVALQFVDDVGKDVTGPQQGVLNELGINVIRSFPGRGIRLWGARSLAAANDALEEWWFIHVRRTMSMIEDSVEKSMQWTVFESNDHNLRRTLTHSLNVFMEQIWLSGGLKGASASEAFYVKCDDTNNPQSQIDQGLLVCEVGVAVAAPMEFLTFQVRRLPDGTGVVEA